MPKTRRQEHLDDIRYSQVGAAGEANTASNIGSDGVGVYDSKNLVDLRFRNIAPASTKVTVVENGDDIDIDVDVSVVEAVVDHDNIANGTDESHVHIGTSAPGAPVLGQLWVDTTGGSVVLQVYDGADWLYVVGNA